MIRVLQVFGRMDRGGAETMIMNIYRNIDRSKVQFDFVVHTSDKCDFDDEIRSLGGRIFSVPRFNIRNALFYKRAWRKLLSEHPEWKIIHGHIMGVASIYLKLAKRFGIITVSHSHTSGDKFGLTESIKNFLEKRIVADYYMACSNVAGIWLFGEEIVKGKKFFILPNAINVSAFDYKPDIRNKKRELLGVKDELLIGHIGRFDKGKNQIFLVEVFKCLTTKVGGIKLLLIGRGELEDLVKKRVFELDLQEKVIFAGVRSDVNELIQAMDVFVFPSLYEGLPVTLVETQTSGLPCVISDTVSTESILTKDLITIMSLNQSADEWAEHIISRLGEKRYSRVEEVKEKGYDIADTSKWLEDFYLEHSR